jgi:hypothetical protein
MEFNKTHISKEMLEASLGISAFCPIIVSALAWISIWGFKRKMERSPVTA